MQGLVLMIKWTGFDDATRETANHRQHPLVPALPGIVFMIMCCIAGTLLFTPYFPLRIMPAAQK